MEGMACLLALLLVLVLPQVRVEANITISERQELRCHSCESENDFNCKNLRHCENEDRFCALVVTKIFPRFFFVSKQCIRYCPAITVPSGPKGFLIGKRLPFVYIRCCGESACNELGPAINETELRGPLESRGELRGSRAGQAVCLTLASTALGLSLP